MKFILALCLLCALAYAPSNRSEFVLDDYYTIVHNPTIKHPELYDKIFSTRLFSAQKSSSYITFPYYRPVLVSSFAVDYQFFKLNPLGYQWTNWLIHFINGLLVFILITLLFKNQWLSFLTAACFLVLPSQEWVVRYITGRGDSLQALFGLICLVSLIKYIDHKKPLLILSGLICLILGALTRESGVLIPLYGILVAYTYSRGKSVEFFSLIWILIGSISTLGVLLLLAIGTKWNLIGKQGPILSQHLLYFISIGICLAVGNLLLKIRCGRWVGIALILFLSLVSTSQRPYWMTEEILLRHTHQMESKHTVSHQQLLIKYDEDQKAIEELIQVESNPILKSMWFWRLGAIAFNHQHYAQALTHFEESLQCDPLNVDAMLAKAVTLFLSGKGQEGEKVLFEAFIMDPQYAPTLRNLGVYYQSQGQTQKAAEFFNKANYVQGL